MCKILIIYSTTDGQTKAICERIKKVSKNIEKIKIISLNKINEENLNLYEQIIIGASIRYGKHNSKIYSFIELNKKILKSKKSAFFSVNVVARKPEKNSPDTNPYMKNFLKKTDWRPDRLAVFAGKVDYPNYSFFNKLVIRFIMYLTKGPTDTSKSYEFTDWKKVEEFAKAII
tara:strand:+ start:2719 stop:3237 length:519 start_codon:yes stop_codon:yes gene_type:complete